MKRPAVVYDADNVPHLGELVEWNRFEGLYAPNNPEEPNMVGRNAVITGATIYIEGDTPTGILNTDVIVARGEELAVLGKVAPWFDAYGQYVGDQFAVQGAVG